LRGRLLTKKGGYKEKKGDKELEFNILGLHADAGLGNPQLSKEEENNV